MAHIKNMRILWLIKINAGGFRCSIRSRKNIATCQAISLNLLKSYLGFLRLLGLFGIFEAMSLLSSGLELRALILHCFEYLGMDLPFTVSKPASQLD